MHLDHMDELTRIGERRDAAADERVAPSAEASTHLVTIPGCRQTRRTVIVAEIGVDMTRFPTVRHLASWAGLWPGNHESAGKRRSWARRPSQPCLDVSAQVSPGSGGSGTMDRLSRPPRRESHRRAQQGVVAVR